MLRLGMILLMLGALPVVGRVSASRRFSHPRSESAAQTPLGPPGGRLER